MNDINAKMARALKWSSISEIVAKFVTPLINMILARILAPEAFGVIATINMVITLAEVFTESGFQKFLIQYNFDSKEKEHQYMSVAFWSNLCFSITVWLLLIIFRDPVASLAGNADLGFPLAMAGMAIPLHGAIGIQNCQLKKSLDFKSLFWVRMISSFTPLAVTLPLALIGFDYWSLIIGNIAGIVVRSVILSILGKFKPAFFFSFGILKHMFGVGIWTLLDGIAVWATTWIDTLLIAHYLDDYYLGLYKNSSSTITMLLSMITAALAPVLFSALSKLQDNKEEFNGMLLSVQRTLSTFLVPMAMGIWLYRGLATDILFGDQWTEAADIIGIMAITTALRTIFVSIYGDVFRAKGHFRIPLIFQIVDLILLVPSCVISVRFGFWALVYTRALIKLDLIIPEMILIRKICGISFGTIFKILWHPVLATSVMSVSAIFLMQVSDGMLWSFLSIAICVAIYFSVLFIFKNERERYLAPILKKIKSRIK